MMTKEELMHRLKQYAIQYAKLVLNLPYNIVNKNYSDQGNRSASSAAANYRAACRAKSHPDFVNKLKIVEEELDESIFFLEMILEINPSLLSEINVLNKEGNDRLAITVASLKRCGFKNRNS